MNLFQPVVHALQSRRHPALWSARRAVCVLVAAASFALARADQPIFTPIETIDIQHIRLELAVDIPAKRVEGSATLTMTPRVEASSVTLDAVNFEVSGVTGTVGGAAPGSANSAAASPETSLQYTNDDSRIEILFGRTVRPGEPVSVRIDYSIDDPKDGLHFFAPSDDDADAPYQVWSQGQSISNRHWFPCFDHPGEMQTTETIITADSKYKVLSNGRLVSRRENPDQGTATWHWSQEQPHVAYLVTMVVGDFAIVEDAWRDVALTYWVPPDRVADVERSFGATKAMLNWMSAAIGVDYPWPKYAQVCCYNYGGGMENTSATTLGENTLHDERAHLDYQSDWLVAHELAHQWFGDLLTCREWAHIWLNEGFASYFEAMWAEQAQGENEFALNMLDKQRSALAGGKDHPIVHRNYSHPDQQFDSRAYPKGAWVLHMLRRRVGDEAFWKIINLHVTRNIHKTVETSDLRRAAEEVTGRSFERFFHDWTERPGHPVLEVAYDWNAEESTAEIKVKQTQEAEPFHFPLVLELDFGAGREPLRIERRMTEKELSLVVPLERMPEMLRVDPGNTVLKEMTEQKPREMWAAQLRRDPDISGRIAAARELGKAGAEAARAVLCEALASDPFWAVRSEAAEQIASLGGEEARDALIAGLDDSDHRVRRQCVESLRKFPNDEKAIAAVKGVIQRGDPSYRVEADALSSYARMGADDAFAVISPALGRESHRDMLRNAVLESLGELQAEGAIALLTEWTAPDKPDRCRRAAIGSLGDIAARLPEDHADLPAVVALIAGALESADGRLRFSAVRSLERLGGRASPALPALELCREKTESSRLRGALDRAMEAIRKDSPAAQQLASLKKELDDLRKENERLLASVRELEARVKTDDAAGAHKAAAGSESAAEKLSGASSDPGR